MRDLLAEQLLAIVMNWTPEDVARTLRWLVSPGAEYVTGQVIKINGGAVR